MEEIPFETTLVPLFEGSTTMSSSVTSTTTEAYAEYEECYNDPMFTIFTYTVDDMLLAASMAATVFNVMVIFCAIKLFKRSGDTMHLFILNMTVGDLVLTIFCHPNELLIRKHDFLQQKHLCAVVHYFNWIGLAVSGLSLTLLNVDKLIYFRWPLNYDRSMSKRRAAMFCLAIWAVSIGFVSYCWLFNIVYIFHQDCSLQMSPSKKFYYEIFTMIFCVLPVTSSLIVSIYLFNLTRSKRNATNAGDTSVLKNKVKSLAFIFATTTWTSCSLLPYRIVNLARIHLFTWSELSCEGKQRMNWIAWVLVYLLTLNPIVNPLITSLIYAPYRLTIKKFLVNIPVGNRPLYSYQPDGLQSDSSFASVRRNRNRRSSCTELASLRQSTEVVRISMSEPPVTPMKSDDGFSFESQSSSDKKLQAGTNSYPQQSVEQFQLFPLIHLSTKVPLVMPFSMGQSVMQSMPSGTWNDFTDLPDEFLSQFGSSLNVYETKPTTCFYSNSFVFFATAMDDVLIASCLLATIVNLIVIVCSFKLYKEKGDTLHLFILNMTVGDLILTLLCHPYEMITRRYTGTQFHTVTVFLNFANWVGLAVSGLSLTLLNLDKLIFFCWPFKYDIWMSYFRAKLFCYLIWIISIGFATYYWMYSYMYFIDRKLDLQKRLEIQFVFLTVFMNGGRLSPINKFFYEAFTVVFCVIPIVSSLLVSCYLYDLTKRKRKLTIGTFPSGKNENKATSFAFIFATTLWTSCSLLPYRLANLARIHMIAWPNLECDTKQSWSWFTWCMLYLLILNPIINPFITAFAYAPYRQLICGSYVKPPFGHIRCFTKMLLSLSGRARKNEKKESEQTIVFHLDLPSDIQDMIKTSRVPHGTIRKAPLANLPSICSCGSLATPDSLHCTRF